MILEKQKDTNTHKYKKQWSRESTKMTQDSINLSKYNKGKKCLFHPALSPRRWISKFGFQIYVHFSLFQFIDF